VNVSTGTCDMSVRIDELLLFRRKMLFTKKTEDLELLDKMLDDSFITELLDAQRVFLRVDPRKKSDNEDETDVFDIIEGVRNGVV
jgi:hypothetical protein